MLNRREKIVMQYLFDTCMSNGDKCLLSAKEISVAVYSKVDWTEYEVDQIINNLALDEYLNVIHSDKKGQTVYCISLAEKGKAFARERHNSKVTTNMLILRTVLLAVLSFVIGLILKAIFT